MCRAPSRDVTWPRYARWAMGHLSFNRKYRSQTFADVVGQDHVTQTLRNSIAEERIAHAFLFSGPRGTGKTSTARILAKALNCEKGGPDPCNQCSSCLEVTEGSSLDVVEIDAASHGSVDDAREIKQKVTTAPIAGRWKVFIIDECHMLSPAANNALLKVLEEPPAHVIFVFATTEPHKVLQTVLDRCQRYEFRAIGARDIADRVAYVCESEGISIDEDAITLIGTRAGGSVRDGLSLLEQLTSFAGNKVTTEDVGKLFGSVPEDVLFETIDVVSLRDVGDAFLLTDRLIRSGTDLREFVRSLVDHLRSLFIILHAKSAQEILEVTDEQFGRLQAQANRFDAAEVLRLIDLANEIHLKLREAVDGRLALEVGVARMTRAELDPTSSAVLARLERLEALMGDPAAAGAARPADQPAAATRPVDQIARPAATAKSADVPAGRDRAVVGDRAVSRQTIVDSTPRRAASKNGSPETAPDAKADSAAKEDTTAKAGATEESPGSAPEAEAEAEADVAVAATGAADEDAAAPQLTVVPHEGELDIEKIQRAWPLLLEKVKRRKISFQALLLPAHPVAWKDNELILEFGPRNGFHRDKVNEPGQQIPLVEAFTEIFGVKPSVRCVMGAEAPAPKAAAKTASVGLSDEDIAGSKEDSDETKAPLSALDHIREAFGEVVVEEG